MAELITLSVEQLLHVLQRTECTFGRDENTETLLGPSWEPRKNRPISKAEGKYLQLLDDLALLIVTRENSDDAAVTMTQLKLPGPGKTMTTFHYCKSYASNDEELGYITKLIDFVNEPRINTGEGRKEFTAHVLSNCRAKLKSRMHKAHKARSEYLQTKATELEMASLPQNQELPLSREIHERYKSPRESELTDFAMRCHGKSTLPYPWQQYLERFFRRMEIIDIQDASFVDSASRLITAANAFQGTRLPRFLGSDKVQRRVAKVGAYARAIVDVLEYVSLEGHKRKFAATEIPIDRASTSIPIQRPSVLAIINAYRQKYHLIEQSFEINELRKVVTGAAPKQAQQKSQQEPDALDVVSPTYTRAHCECLLASWWLRNYDRDFIIGISKRCCGPCLAYLRTLALVKARNIIISGSHGKLHSGWSMPPQDVSNPEICNRFMDVIRAEMDRLILSMDTRRDPDSDEPTHLGRRETSAEWTKNEAESGFPQFDDF